MNKSWSLTWTLINKWPGFIPLSPDPPSFNNLTVFPVSIPAGILTETDLLPAFVPRPPHGLHGFEGICPLPIIQMSKLYFVELLLFRLKKNFLSVSQNKPEQVRQGAAILKIPPKAFCSTIPFPEHVLQAVLTRNNNYF